MEERREDLRSRLPGQSSCEELEERRDESLSAMIHDLKSPLSSMLSFIDLLEDPAYGEISEKKRGFLQAMRRSGGLLMELIANMLMVARLDGGLMECEFKPFSLEALFSELEESFAPQALTAGVRLDLSCGQGLTVYGDRGCIRHIFHNLLSNAIKFTPPGGAVSISASPGGGRAVIEVADTGAGIPPAQQGELFQKFTRGNTERRGSGLGLYIVKKLLEEHGADVRVESAPGEGTRFFFTLPGDGGAPEAPVAQDEPGVTGRLLLVGEPSRCRGLSDALEADGHTVETAISGMEGLSRAAASTFDLVVLCSDLPDLPSEELQQALGTSAATAGLPVLDAAGAGELRGAIRRALRSREQGAARPPA